MFNSGMGVMLKSMLGVTDDDIKRVTEEVIPKLIADAQHAAQRCIELEHKVDVILRNQAVIYNALIKSGVIEPPVNKSIEDKDDAGIH